MTTPARETLYLAQHLVGWEGRGYAFFNPHNRPLEELPIIYGFNNGGPPEFYRACLLAEDGAGLGDHICSHEAYMTADLGVLEGSRPDRHETFREHYPDGYRMDFIPAPDVKTHPGLEAAYNRHIAAQKEQLSASTKDGGRMKPFMCGSCHKQFTTEGGATAHALNKHSRKYRVSIFKACAYVEPADDELSFADRARAAEIAIACAEYTDDDWLLP